MTKEKQFIRAQGSSRISEIRSFITWPWTKREVKEKVKAFYFTLGAKQASAAFLREPTVWKAPIVWLEPATFRFECTALTICTTGHKSVKIVWQWQLASGGSTKEGIQICLRGHAKTCFLLLWVQPGKVDPQPGSHISMTNTRSSQSPPCTRPTTCPSYSQQETDSQKINTKWQSTPSTSAGRMYTQPGRAPSCHSLDKSRPTWPSCGFMKMLIRASNCKKRVKVLTTWKGVDSLQIGH